MEINNKIAIITGGTGGIGLCITKELLRNGAKCVAIFDLDNERSRTIFNELKDEFGEKVEFYSCDVTISKQISDNMDKVIEAHKTFDILINNAGIGDERNTELLIDINFKAVIVGSCEMIKRVSKENGGQGGVIVNIASILGLMNFTLAPKYSAIKHGIVSFTKTMKETYKTSGVRIVAICPGYTKTDMIARISPQYINVIEKKYNVPFPMQKPENVGLAVISIITSGKSGDIWISENDEPPYPAKDVEAYP